MNNQNRSNPGNKKGKKARRRQRNAGRVQPVVVVPVPRPPPRRKPRQPRQRRPRAQRTNSEQLEFLINSLTGTSKGQVTFGKSLSSCKGMKGICDGFKEFKIGPVDIFWKTEAASTASGSMCYEIDPHLKLTELSSDLDRFGITESGKAHFTADEVNGKNWLSTEDDQFRLLYKGNGTNSVAGYFKVRFTVFFRGPK